MAELADATDSKSVDLRVMGVRPPLPAPSELLYLEGSESLALNSCRESGLAVVKV